ncbi:hypothetical protein ACQ1R0_03810 [Ornithobacterium rhinotracheale]|uniref:hypothetical protein n=1 Tax=Ornithobacterium rhinotracheale TaxID=28251 RepID=UPI0040352CD8
MITAIKTGINLRANSRKVSFIRARSIFRALCAKYTLFNNEEIADFLGVTEGAIRHACRLHEKEMAFNHDYRFNYNEIDKIIKEIGTNKN